MSHRIGLSDEERRQRFESLQSNQENIIPCRDVVVDLSDFPNSGIERLRKTINKGRVSLKCRIQASIIYVLAAALT
jgi:hypothetical protein